MEPEGSQQHGFKSDLLSMSLKAGQDQFAFKGPPEV